MSDAVQLALIGMVSSICATIGVGVVAYFQYGAKKEAKSTHETVRRSAEISRDTNAVVTETKKVTEAVHEQTNGRLLRAEAELAEVKAERDRLVAEFGARRKGDA
jgi:IMP dehydrogenase/GMP reductase